MRLFTDAFDYGMLPPTHDHHALRPSQGVCSADIGLASNSMKRLRHVECTRRSFRSLKGALMYELDTQDAATAKGNLLCSYRARR
jgi:hypothetical protein